MTIQLDNKKILICPLDWGMGHASRCIPIIRNLVELDCDVIVAAQGAVKAFLALEFPGIIFVPIVNYNISYATTSLGLIFKFPYFLLRVFYCAYVEHQQIKKLIKDHSIDCVISDNRFGCFSKDIYSVYISHQLCVLLPKWARVFEWFLWKGLRWAINQYDMLWIPDYPGKKSLTGLLINKFSIPEQCRFVGVLSRFMGNNEVFEDGNLDLLVMLSGPEPQRTMLENKIIEELRGFSGSAIVLLCKPEESYTKNISEQIRLISHVPTEKMVEYINRAKQIICRGGYTTIMELVSLQKKAILIPTPGQTEQIYLGDRLTKKGCFYSVSQKEFKLQRSLDKLKDINGFQIDNNEDLLNEAVFDMIKKIK